VACSREAVNGPDFEGAGSMVHADCECKAANGGAGRRLFLFFGQDTR
jgi:hypothetical protein